MADTITFALDVFSVFNGRLSFSGWLFGASPIASIAFRSSGVAGGSFPLASYGTVPSPDVAQHYGPAGARARFSETCDFVATTETLADAHFLITYTNGRTEGLGDLVGQQPNPANLMAPRFAKLLRE